MGRLFEHLVSACILIISLPDIAGNGIVDAAEWLKLTSCALSDDDPYVVRLRGHAMIAKPEACESLRTTGSRVQAVSSGGLPSTLNADLSEPDEAGGCTLEVRAGLPLLDPFECSETKFELHVAPPTTQPRAEGPGAAPAVANFSGSFCSQPACEWYATEMPLRGGDGLVTEHGSAQLGLLCSHPVVVADDCIRVEFRSNENRAQAVTVEYSYQWETAVDSGQRAELLLEWEPSFRGEITVDVEDARERQQCGLGLKQPLVCPSCDCSLDVLAASSEGKVDYQCHDGMKVFHSPDAIAPITFTAVDSLPLRTLATSVPYVCSGDQHCGHSEL